MRKWLWIFLPIIIFILIFSVFFGEKQKAPDTEIRGVIIPHHALAASLLDESFKRLKDKTNPSMVVIYGTNHYFPVSETFTTTQEVKNTYNLDNVLADDERVAGDHSVQTAAPYIRSYFPNAKIVPILVSTRYGSMEELREAAESFVKIFGGINTLYIASVDFAHNVSLDAGLKNNSESIASIAGFNYGEILSYHDEHMDSPVAIATLLLTMQSLGAGKWETWYSSHGALITGNFNSEGTSYVVGSFSN